MRLRCPVAARPFWELGLLRRAATGQAWALTAACELVARCKTACKVFSQQYLYRCLLFCFIRLCCFKHGFYARPAFESRAHLLQPSYNAAEGM